MTKWVGLEFVAVHGDYLYEIRLPGMKEALCGKPCVGLKADDCVLRKHCCPDCLTVYDDIGVYDWGKR